MTLEITSDRGRIGPFQWYNQKPIRYYRAVVDDNGSWITGWQEVETREGFGYCFFQFDGVITVPFPPDWLSDLVWKFKEFVGAVPKLTWSDDD